MKEGLDKKRIDQIANFIVNNITLAEVSSLVIEKARDTAEFIVNNNIDPNSLESPVTRKKLYKKIKNLKSEVKEDIEDKSWYNKILNKVGLGDEEKKVKSHKGFNTSGK